MMSSISTKEGALVTTPGTGEVSGGMVRPLPIAGSVKEAVARAGDVVGDVAGDIAGGVKGDVAGDVAASSIC